MNVLVIYEAIPESVTFYILDVSADEWSILALTHEQYDNAVDVSAEAEAALAWLRERLSNESPVDTAAPLDVKALGIDRIVKTGFLL